MILNFYSIFSMNILLANKIAPDGMQHTVASHLELYCLLVSYKKDARLLQVKSFNICSYMIICDNNTTFIDSFETLSTLCDK